MSEFTPAVENPPVILIPGLSGRAAADFAFLAPMLARRHRVVAVDFDDLPPDHNLSDLIARVDAAVRDCDERPVIVGYSIGALAAIGYAATKPLRASSIVAIAGWLEPAPKLLAFASLLTALRSEGSALVGDAARQAMFSAHGWDSAVAQRVDDSADRMVALAARSDVTAFAPEVTVPTLVIGCAHDEVATTHQSKLLFASIADARYAEILSGHAVVHERPAQVLAMIESFAFRPSRYSAGALIGEDSP